MNLNREDRLLKLLLGKHYNQNYGVVHKLSDIPKKLRTKIWGRNDESLFARYSSFGQFFWIRKDENIFLVHLADDGSLKIVDKNDRTLDHNKFELELGTNYVGMSLIEFLEYLLKKDNMKNIKESKKVIKLTENDLINLVKRVVAEQDGTEYANPNQTYADKSQMRQDFRDQRQQLRQDQRAVRQNTRQAARTVRRDERAERAAVTDIKNAITELNTTLASMNRLASAHGNTETYKSVENLVTPIITAVQAFVNSAGNL